jgi:prepilin peptidase CpaA
MASTFHVAALVFTFSMIWAGVSDLTTMKIRNALVLSLVAAYAVLAPLAGFGSREIELSALVAFGILGFGFFCFARGWMGGGDAKLASVTALWLGAEHTTAYVIYTALFGAVLTFALLQFRTRLSILPTYLQSTWLLRLHNRDCGVPYGVAMAVAALVVFPSTRWITTLF